jgi:hypothetical protein
MYVFASQKYWNNLVWEASAGVLKIVVIIGRNKFPIP